jgi:Antitoxin of toxin-antitoxin, RelE / RelB, TA system
MNSSRALPSLDFSQAKSTLSDVMTQVVHGHQPRIVSRHRGKEQMLVVGTDDLARYLDTFRFDPEVVIDEGEVTVELAELGVLGFGETVEAAMEDLLGELRLYSARFFERPSFYMHTDRAHHAPWLLRFALTPAEHQLGLLYSDPRETASTDE